jgi:hypothetical protein
MFLAAERRQIIATAEKPWFSFTKSDEPQRCERIFRSYRGLRVACIQIHGLSAVLLKCNESQSPP